MSGDAFGIHIGLAIPSCANRHAGPSQLAAAPHTGPAGRTSGLVNLPNETSALSSSLRAGAARPESEEHRTWSNLRQDLFDCPNCRTRAVGPLLDSAVQDPFA